AIPAARYDKLRFNIGLPPAINHKDPTAYPAGHPLNPQVNGLHWGWMGGYVFLALEGQWTGAPPLGGRNARDAETPKRSRGSEQDSPFLPPKGGVPIQSGYSYHLATDSQLMTVELSIVLDLSSNRQLQL